MTRHLAQRATILLLTTFAWTTTAAAGENLLANGDFERGLAGWGDLWTRTPGGRVSLDQKEVHGGQQAVKIEHAGTEDWSYQQAAPLEVEPGEIFGLSGWVRVEGEGRATLCVTLRDAGGEVIDWAYAGRSANAAPNWRELRCRFVIPPGGATIHPRWIGHGPATVWVDDVALRRGGSVDQLRRADLPAELKVETEQLQVTLRTADGTVSVTDRRSGKTWSQRARARLNVLDAERTAEGFGLRLLEPAGALPIEVTVHLDPAVPEITFELRADGEMARHLAYPAPFVTDAGTFLVMPVNEGISYPVDDGTLEPMYYHLYGGHGLCMGFWGVSDGEAAVMAIVETPDDAAVRVPRVDGRLCLAPEWVPQKGHFGPARRIRYVFFDRGGYVAMCKRYRKRARRIGLLKTLSEKRAANPNVDRLVGAVNVWCWDRDPVAVCRELRSAGIERILWSHRSDPEAIHRLNAMGILTSRYDIYQDVMNPANFDKLHGVHPDWTTAAWPNDLMIAEDGQWQRGWRVRGKDGQWYPCGVLCDRQAVQYARRRIPAELKKHSYGCRFIDTTTAAPWRECYHDDHPMTRSESRHWKMQLLRLVSGERGLVTGSETGHDAAVPYVHYFEGMLSLGPYRVPEAGRRMIEPWHEVPPRVAKFQTGHYYRLPLWELVYHDCVVAQWYWGDYNNKLPSLWDRRDLFNALYATPPMFMFNRQIWQKHHDRFAQSYRNVAPVVRAAGYREMLSHGWLTEDHAVQQTEFAGGVRVTVNFGPTPHTLADGTTLGSLEQRVTGISVP